MTHYATQNTLLLQNLLEFYSQDNHLERILPIINGKSEVSLRLIDWFATNYCKKHYININEWIFHRKVTGPYWNGAFRNKEGKLIWRRCAPDGHYPASRKYRACYRCGRFGHYYWKKECCAFTDNNGVEITWGIRRIPSKKKAHM